MVGASDDDLKVLLTKRFLLPFENGVVVVKHWLINNLVRKDFYQPTIYTEEKKRLEIKENKAYTENVNNLSPQVRLGKDRIGNNLSAKADEGVTYEPVNDEGEKLVKRKGMKRLVTEAPYPFDFDKEVQRLIDSPQITHNIAGHYILFKGLNFENRDQYEPALSRIVGAAKSLKGYSGEQIQKAFEYCKEGWPDIWTLETVIKRIPEALIKK